MGHDCHRRRSVYDKLVPCDPTSLYEMCACMVPTTPINHINGSHVLQNRSRGGPYIDFRVYLRSSKCPIYASLFKKQAIRPLHKTILATNDTLSDKMLQVLYDLESFYFALPWTILFIFSVEDEINFTFASAPIYPPNSSWWRRQQSRLETFSTKAT